MADTSQSQPQRWRSLLETTSNAAVIVACASVIWLVVGSKRPMVADQPKRTEAARRSATIPVPKEPVSIEGAALKGNRNAAVAIIVYSDFQCPFCATFAQGLLTELDRQYIAPGRVVLAFRHLPLDSIHPQAKVAALSAECARRQGRFWQLHDRMFSNPKLLSPPFIQEQAAESGLAVKIFADCMASPPTEVIDADVAFARRLGISGTPTFLVGRMQGGAVGVETILEGAKSAAVFTRVLDNLLQR